MERRGDKVYVDGKKVFEVQEGGEGRRFISLTPMSIRQYHSMRPKATKQEYEDQIVSWYKEYMVFDSERCLEEMKRRTCLDEVMKVSAEAGHRLLETINYRCKRSRDDYDLVW
jgi:hypothetical protein